MVVSILTNGHTLSLSQDAIPTSTLRRASSTSAPPVQSPDDFPVVRYIPVSQIPGPLGFGVSGFRGRDYHTR